MDLTVVYVTNLFEIQKCEIISFPIQQQQKNYNQWSILTVKKTKLYQSLLSNSTVLTPNASKALDKLGPFLAFVCDYLQCRSKFFVVVSKPFQQRHALNQLMFLPCLETQAMSARCGVVANN